MNKILLRIGGVINLLFVLLHLAMVKGIGIALAPYPLISRRSYTY